MNHSSEKHLEIHSGRKQYSHNLCAEYKSLLWGSGGKGSLKLGKLFKILYPSELEGDTERREERPAGAIGLISASPENKETSLDACTLALHFPEKAKCVFRDVLTTVGVHFTLLRENKGGFLCLITWEGSVPTSWNVSKVVSNGIYTGYN